MALGLVSQRFAVAYETYAAFLRQRTRSFVFGAQLGK